MRLVSIFYSCIVVVILAGCQALYSDVSTEQKSMSISFAEKGYYYSPAWVLDNIIVFNYKASQDFPTYPDVVVPDLRFYDARKGTWGKIPFPSDKNCPWLGLGFLQKLPNKHLGAISTCTPSSGNQIRTIQEIDIATNEIKNLAESGPIHIAGQFSFSPDMSEFVQEDMIGRYLDNRLFYRKGNTATQIVPDFIRAMYPAWSPHDREIAFWGTESYSKGNPTEFTTSDEISGLALYPFDLYISTPEGTNLKKILSSVKNPLPLKWSPKEKMISFGGEYGGVPGIWLIDPATSKVIRIWAKASDFDWSPDGSKMVILDQETDKEGKISSQSISIVDMK